MVTHVPYKCSQCNKVVETTKAKRVVSESIPITEQKRKDFLKSDFEVIHKVEEGMYCEWCGHTGGEEDFVEVEPEEKVEKEEVVFDKKKHYENYLKWIEHIRDMVKKEYGEVPKDETSKDS